jgi:hypothetical protein
LAWKNPVFLPAITAHAVLRQKATAQTLTPAWLKKKEKAILYSLCAHSHIDPAIIEYLDSKKKVAWANRLTAARASRFRQWYDML